METRVKARADGIARWTEKGDQVPTEISGLSLFQGQKITPPVNNRYELRISALLKGANGSCRVSFCLWRPRRYLIFSVHNLPTVVQTIGASNGRPYRGLVLKLAQREIFYRLLVGDQGGAFVKSPRQVSQG
ncbi:MAG: AraC family transcriptional regulator N-terminal domain-containing protein [Desulfobulbus sp.]|nr:AraC family transcriptional regulator N-terminal domain-containing protein [Desulfobulbus sp.]